jgi:hypothetical protein
MGGGWVFAEVVSSNEIKGPGKNVNLRLLPRKEQASGGRTREGLGDNNKRLDVCRTRASEADTDEPGRGGKKGEKGGGGGGGGSGCLGRSTGASTTTCYTSRSPASGAPRGTSRQPMAAMGGLIHSSGALGPKMRSSQKARSGRAARGRGPPISFSLLPQLTQAGPARSYKPKHKTNPISLFSADNGEQKLSISCGAGYE